MSSSANAAVAASGILKVPRIHVMDAVVPNNGQLGPSMTIQADADFEWWWLSIFRTNALLKALIAVSRQRQPPIRLQRQSAGEQFSGDPGG